MMIIINFMMVNDDQHQGNHTCHHYHQTKSGPKLLHDHHDYDHDHDLHHRHHDLQYLEHGLHVLHNDAVMHSLMLPYLLFASSNCHPTIYDDDDDDHDDLDDYDDDDDDYDCAMCM